MVWERRKVLACSKLMLAVMEPELESWLLATKKQWPWSQDHFNRIRNDRRGNWSIVKDSKTYHSVTKHPLIRDWVQLEAISIRATAACDTGLKGKTQLEMSELEKTSWKYSWYSIYSSTPGYLLGANYLSSIGDVSDLTTSTSCLFWLSTTTRNQETNYIT